MRTPRRLQSFEETWNEDALKDGFDLSRTAPGKVRVCSKAKTAMMAFGDGEQNVIHGPSFFADLDNDPKAVDVFFAKKEKSGFWVMHFRTMAASYIYIVDHHTGQIESKMKKDPMGVVETKEDHDDRPQT